MPVCSDPLDVGPASRILHHHNIISEMSHNLGRETKADRGQATYASHAAEMTTPEVELNQVCLTFKVSLLTTTGYTISLSLPQDGRS